MSSYSANESGNTIQPRDFKSEDSINNMANTRYGNSSPFYSPAAMRPKSEPSADGLSLNVKNLFSGSLMSVGQSDIGRSCYDVTLMDGTEGTVIKSLPDSILGLPSTHTKENMSGSHLVEPAFRAPPPPPLSSLATPTAVLKTAKEPKFTKAEDAISEGLGSETKGKMANGDCSSSTTGAVRAGGRHHLIDIHGMAIFLRQSTRCLSCREACCLYVTGTISAQLAAVTQMKITCQKCHYTASQVLLRPNQVPEQMNAQPSSNSHSPNQTSMLKDSNITKPDKEVEKKPPRASPKFSKGKGGPKSSQRERNLPKVQYSLRENPGIRKDVKSQRESSISPDSETLEANCRPTVLSVGNPQPDSTGEWRGKSYFSATNEKPVSSPLPPCTFPDISLTNGLSNLCDETTCCPSKLGTSLCPVTGILRQLSPSIGNLQDLPQYSHTPDKPEDLRHHRKTLNDEGQDPNKKGSYLAKLLQTKLHNDLSPAPSPCSLSSSPSSSLSSSISSSSMLSSCARNSCSPTASSTATPSSNAMVHTAPSLLKLWSSQGLGQTLPLSSQIYSPMNAYNYQGSLSPADLQASFPMKRKLQEDVEESLRRVRRMIYNTKSTPQFETIENDGCRSSGPSKVTSDSQLLSDDDGEHKLDFGTFLSENYLEYLQEKIMRNAFGDSRSSECQSGDLGASTKRICRHDNKQCQDKRRHCHDTENGKCSDLYEDSDHSQLQKPAADCNSKIVDSSSKAKNAGEDNMNSTPPSPSHEESSGCATNPRKKITQSMLRPKLFLKLEKRRFKRRNKFDPRSMHRWIKASSVPCYCCYDLNYHRRMLIKQRSKKSHQSTKDKSEKPPIAEQPSEQSKETTKENSTNKNNIEDLNAFLDRKENEETDDSKIYDGRRRGNENELPQTEISRKVGIDQKQLEAVHNEHCAVIGWMKCQNIESKCKNRECTCGKDKKKTKRRSYLGHERIMKPGKFHDLLSSESDSDSEEGKLTIDFKEET